MTDNYVLPNGTTFLAITAGLYGSWAKASDPVTAMKNAHKNAGGNKNAVYVIHGVSDEIHCTQMGGYEWKNENPPTPLGIFTVTNRSIKALAKGDFHKDHGDCEEWMIDQLDQFDRWKKMREEEKK